MLDRLAESNRRADASGRGLVPLARARERIATSSISRGELGLPPRRVIRPQVPLGWWVDGEEESVSRPTRFEAHRYLGDKRTQVVYDLDHPPDESVIDERSEEHTSELQSH